MAFYEYLGSEAYEDLVWFTFSLDYFIELFTIESFPNNTCLLQLLLSEIENE